MTTINGLPEGGSGGSEQGTSGSQMWKVAMRDSASGEGVSAGDATNNAIRVNLVAGGGAGGGAAQLQIISGSTWVNVAGDVAESPTARHVPIKIMGTGSSIVEPRNIDPLGPEWAIPVRNIPSGMHSISGTIHQGTSPWLTSGSQTVSQGNAAMLNATVAQGSNPWVVSSSLLNNVTGSVSLAAPALVNQGLAGTAP